MASNSIGLQPNSDGLQPNGDGLQPNSPKEVSDLQTIHLMTPDQLFPPGRMKLNARHPSTSTKCSGLSLEPFNALPHDEGPTWKCTLL